MKNNKPCTYPNCRCNRVQDVLIKSKDMTDTQIKQVIGQQEASIEKVETLLSEEEFVSYCDAIYTTITIWKVILKRRKEEQENE